MYACHLQHATAAALLLDRSITLDAELGRRIDGGPGRSAFIQYFMANKRSTFTNADPSGPWQAFVMRQVDARDARRRHDILCRRIAARSMDAGRRMREISGRIDRAGGAARSRSFHYALFLISIPLCCARRVPPPSQAIEFAFTYAKTHLLPTLLRIWPLPDDLPHAAGNGDFARVKSWFDAAGKPALGDLANHFPANNARTPAGTCNGGERPSVQQVLDTALAWAVLNNHFEIADFLLGHGADINTNWSSHEPASILHELVWFHKNYEAMQFLIDRGIDMTIVDYRWGATAQGWAYHAAKDEKMAQWLRRGATTAGAGIALKATRRINQKVAPACATFHREPRQVGFRTFFLSAVGVTNTAAGRFPGREQTVGE